jgi:type VI secretion system protein ImpA
MAFIDVDALLAPVSESEPSGPDLEYDSAFLALEEAARGKPEQQFGDTIIPAEEPDWRAVQAAATTLLGRSKDVRLAVHLLRASTRLQGLGAAAEGLRLVEGLLSRYWDSVHPMLDTTDNNDPTMRLNALAPLVDLQAFLMDVRRANLLAGRSSITGRDFELSTGKAQPTEGETVIPLAGLLQALQDGEAQQAGLLDALAGMSATVSAIDGVVNERASLSGPEFRPLKVLTQIIGDAVGQARGAQTGTESSSEAGAADASSPAGVGAMAVAAPAGALRTREDVVMALEKCCQWIELNEPSNPAPLLIRRGQRLMSMNFMDIIRDMVPDGVDQVVKLAGVPADQQY